MDPKLLTSIREHVAVLFKYKWMIFGIVALTFSLVVGVSYVIPEKYQATAEVLVKPGRQKAGPSSVIQRSAVTSLFTVNLTKEDVLSEVEIIKSDMLIEKAMDAVGRDVLAPPLRRGDGFWRTVTYYLKYGWGEMKEAIREVVYELGLSQRLTDEQRLTLAVHSSLEVDQVRNTNVISVSFSWPLPGAAASFVNALVDLYMQHHIEVHHDEQMLGFIDQEVTRAEESLLQTERKLHDFRVSTGVVSPEEQRSLLLRREDALEAEIQSVRARSGELAVKLDALNTQIREERNQISLGSPMINQALRQESLALEVELAGLEEKQKHLEEDLAALDRRLKLLDAQEVELQRLVRQRDLERENFMLYRQKQEETALSANMDLNEIIDVAVFDPAEIPMRPDRLIGLLPNKILNLLLALVGSFMIAVVLAFVRHYADHTLDTKRKVESFTGLRVLGSLPHLPAR